MQRMEVDGIPFYKEKTGMGYWLSSKPNGWDAPKRLHVYVWEKHKGTISTGYAIHHKDHNPDNNEIENLEMVKISDHARYHVNLRDKEELKDILNEKARPKAVEWHKSEEGREWHKSHYQKTKEGLHQRVLIICEYCGKTVEKGKGGSGNRFCSDKCKNDFRLKRDLTETVCKICGKAFVSNRTKPATCCSHECRVVARNESKRNKKNTE